MKEETRWIVLVGTALVGIAIFLTVLHYLIFQDLHHIAIYFLGDLAFIPVEVLCVTLIIDQLLESREKKQRMEKLNMVIGIFFSRVGTPLMARLATADTCVMPLRNELAIRPGDWTADRFRAAQAGLSDWHCKVDPAHVDREALREFLQSNEDFLLRIMENPTIFEHESFTDLMFAVTHLEEELSARGDLSNLPPTDLAHLETDMERVYSQLVPEWLKYMEYLRNHYPYLFSLAMRQNPFDKMASVVVMG
ncbi:MAG: hypothetical protein M0R30_00515 [Methanoregula sp.]|uniref:hypothetical protein n=1 Tax=Methanoregula sp. TaxID=2052170 RepID=UPI0025FB7258|nr:hypothetical protein [Methanoregula sp.]MCK9630101.1 hypothetical protein [Methanoregula sp.]